MVVQSSLSSSFYSIALHLWSLDKRAASASGSLLTSHNSQFIERKTHHFWPWCVRNFQQSMNISLIWKEEVFFHLLEKPFSKWRVMLRLRGFYKKSSNWIQEELKVYNSRRNFWVSHGVHSNFFDNRLSQLEMFTFGHQAYFMT